MSCKHCNNSGKVCMECGRGMELKFIPEPVLRWFRGLSKPVQWLIGVPTIALLLRAWWDEQFHVPQPGEPQKAIWVTLILFVVTILLNELLRPKPQIEDARPKGLGDFQFPTATEGRVVPLVFGKVRLRGPNVVWYGDLEQYALSKFFKSGLWSGKRVIVAFRYYLGVQMALCRGPGAVLKRVWIGDTEVFSGTVNTDGGTFDIDKPELFGGDEYGNGGVLARCDFYTGSNTQAVNAYLDDANRQRIVTAATPTAPAYRGTCYIVARWLPTDLENGTHEGCYLGNSTTIKPWSFEVERYPALFSGQSGSQNKIGSDDANPVNVIYELLTNDEWGFGFAASDIDVGAGSSFKSAADVMITEANGFSLNLDRPMRAKDLLQELQRQIDGVVFLDQRTGKWKIKLARADYSIGSVPQLNDGNVSEVQEYTRGSWEDTTNQIMVQYTKRADDYKESYAVAQDMANAMIQGGGSPATSNVIAAQVSYPGVMNGTLASNLAWRDLRGQSYPLARAKLVVSREFWNLNIGDVVAWTSTALGFTQLPMRINRIDYGRLDANEIVLTVVQDVFLFAAASYGNGPATGWTNPVVDLAAYPSDQQAAIECPRAILVRDPEFAGDATVARIIAAARRQAGEVAFTITQRHASGSPGGTYADDGDVVQFVRIGELQSGLNAGVANPTASITIVPDPDTQAALETVFNDLSTTTDLGVDLAHLIMVGTEFMLVTSASNSGGNVALANVYRGALDSAQQKHAAATPVFLLFVGAGLNETNIPNTNNVDVQLRARSSVLTYAGAVTTISFAMAKRALRPYPPNAPLYNGSGTPFATPSVEGAGSGANGLGINVSWRRRRFNCANEVDELLADFAPDASTEYRVRVFVDPDGVNTEITGSPFAWAAGTGPQFVNRLRLWEIAAAGTKIRVQIEVRHDIGTEVDLTGRYAMLHDVTPTSANDGKFYLGGNKSANQATNSYTTLATGTYVVNIGAAYSTSNVQARVNAGAWNTVITAGGTTGNIAGITAGDTIELRHTVNEAPDPQYVELVNPSAVVVGYGTFSA
jgi:hypothetical protein